MTDVIATGLAYSAAGAGPWVLGMVLGRLAMLAFLGLVVVGVILLVRAVTRSLPLTGRPSGPADTPPFDILKRRYAAGDITREQYAEMRQTLEQ